MQIDGNGKTENDHDTDQSVIGLSITFDGSLIGTMMTAPTAGTMTTAA